MKKQMLFLLVAICCQLTIVQGQNSGKKFSLEDLMKKRIFSASSIDGFRSTNDGQHYTTLSDDYQRIEKFSYKSGQKVSTILDLSKQQFPEVKMIVDYHFNADETSLLIQANYEPLYRRSFKADFYIYNLDAKTLVPLSKNGKQQLATFSPDGHKVAFVRDNNLFIKNLSDDKEIQITSDGKSNEIINGAPDWVYEEEFEFNKAFDWSPDGSKLVYLKFDEREVKMFNMTMFQGQKPALDQNALYPSNNQFKYPKAGEDNSKVSVHVYNLDSGNTLKVNLRGGNESYLPRIVFTPKSGSFIVMRLNRLQNKLELIRIDALSGKLETVYTEENNRYIDEGNFDHVTFLPDDERFIITSEKDGYSHLYLHNMTSLETRQLTSGRFDVTKVYGYDPKEEVVYYQAAAVSPLRREIYSVSLDNRRIKTIAGTSGTNDAGFSKSFRYYIHTFSSASQPPVYSLYQSPSKLIRVLENNQALMDTLALYKPPFKKFFNIKTSVDTLLHGWMLFPPDFDSTLQYPLLMNQYSGPNSQEVLDRWGIGFDEYMAQQGYVVMCVDPRGTGARGQEFRKMTYMQLGKFETIDQLEAARYAGNLPYIDAARMSIWGWSYGGFISSSVMVKGDGLFKVGIAVAPVTNWRYYDNIYTERFMRKPQDNAKGYDDNSPLFFAHKLKGKLLLVHGTADDNVHVQNTLEFAERLVQAEKQFDMMLYTNRNHGIYGGNTRMHLFTMIEDYLNKNL
ncbi:MAG TPA: S9 family peptidase [Bacteroidales bacterium]|jgi:dipeptidyl-peptidase-4|nr:S9 family peptidase [Bacteroidales bacterium]